MTCQSFLISQVFLSLQIRYEERGEVPTTLARVILYERTIETNRNSVPLFSLTIDSFKSPSLNYITIVLHYRWITSRSDIDEINNKQTFWQQWKVQYTDITSSTMIDLTFILWGSSFCHSFLVDSLQKETLGRK